MSSPLHIVLDCAERFRPRARYVLDTLLMAAGVPVIYVGQPPASGPWLFYGRSKVASWPFERCLAIAYCPESWLFIERKRDVDSKATIDGLTAVLPATSAGFEPPDIAFDMLANAFFFLASCPERTSAGEGRTRRLYSESTYARLGVPQDVVDQYLCRLLRMLDALCGRLEISQWRPVEWPETASYALVLSHDIDFIPRSRLDVATQGAKSVLRHLLRQGDPADALRAAAGLARAVATGRDAYGCVPEIIRRERELGVRSSLQVAVGHRHPADVNYRIQDDRIRDYLRAIPDSGFDLCLHGSYRSTENPEWYIEEVALLTQRLGRPLGSRQHFLAFDYDTLFSAQERAGIQYDMSMGFPDRIGPRAGFSYPYFPYCVSEDRPYDVVQISLFMMDVTLQSYMGLKGKRAWEAILATLQDLRYKRGCVSVVWHPIVFGGARDPGYDQLYWDMVEYVRRTGGLATDGRTINAYWREQAQAYPSFAFRSGH